jgi:hypothetical protein
MLMAIGESNLLDLAYEDHQNLEIFQSARRQWGWSENVLLNTIKSLLQRDLLSAYRFDQDKNAYIELEAGDRIDPLSAWYLATDEGRHQVDIQFNASGR